VSVDSEDLDLGQVRVAVQLLNLGSDLEHGRAINRDFADQLLSAINEFRVEMSVGTTIYRARLMTVERELDADPFPIEEMGPPPSAVAGAGRLNRKGFPRFYGALDAETAVAECRPWRGARLSVAGFRNSTSLPLVDLSGTQASSRATPIVEWLNFILGRPVHRDDDGSYLPSQWLAEECERHGLAGLLYKSAMRPGGINVVLFAWDQLSGMGVEFHEVSGISYRTTELSAAMTPNER